MPIDLHALAKDRREFEFEYGGMTMPVVYRPSVMTGRYAQALADGESIDDLAVKVAEVIADWDLVNGSEKVPVTADAIAELPTVMMTKLLNDITEDAGIKVPDEGKATTATNRPGRRTKATSTASNGS